MKNDNFVNKSPFLKVSPKKVNQSRILCNTLFDDSFFLTLFISCFCPNSTYLQALCLPPYTEDITILNIGRKTIILLWGGQISPPLILSFYSIYSVRDAKIPLDISSNFACILDDVTSPLIRPAPNAAATSQYLPI